MQIPLFFLCIAAGCFPGVTLWVRLIQKSNTLESWITGICFALSAVFCAVFILGYLHLSYFFLFWGVLLLFSFFVWVKKKDFNTLFCKPDNTLKWVACVFSLAAVVRFLPLFYNEYPLGWDPYFHLLIIEKIIKAKSHVFDLNPFENIPINYPIGTHLFVATISQVIHVASHTVFQLAIAFFGTMLCVQVFALLSVATNNRRDLALYGTASYSFLALMGSVDYYAWGGLPNLVGVYFLLGALTLLMSEKNDKKIFYLLPFLFAGTCFSNHHTLGTAVVVIFVILLFFLISKEKREDGIRLLFSGVTALVLALPSIIPKVFNDYSINDTGLLIYMEELHTIGFISEKMGYGFFATSISGIVLFIIFRKSLTVNRIFFIAFFVLITLFVCFEYVSRMITPGILGRSIAPFTPGRFLTDAVPILAFFPGFFFWKVQGKTGLSSKWILCLILLTGLSTINGYKIQFTPELDPDRKEAYAWIKNNTPESTLVLDEFIHAAFLTQRAAFNTPIPSSELWSRARKRQLMRAIATQSVPPEAAQVPVVYISPKINTSFKNTKVLWKHPVANLFVLELYDGRRR